MKKIDKGCKQKGVASDIGCQNQSLGEDVPIVGTGFNLRYEGSRAPGAASSVAGADPFIAIGGWTLSVHHAYDVSSNLLYLGDGGQRSAMQLGPPLKLHDHYLLTSEDDSEVYVFDVSTGRHLKTVKPLTGALLYRFGYNASGHVVTVTDGSGNVTAIDRDGSEHATAIVSPYGQTTALGLDGNGFLNQVTDPLGKSVTFTNTSTGLLMARTDKNGNVYNYTYDGQGGLAKDADPVGGSITLIRTDAASGFAFNVAETTALGRTSGYQTTLHLPWVDDGTATSSEHLRNTWPSGLQATKAQKKESGQLANSVTLPDGTSSSETLVPDQVWGLQVPIAQSQTLTRGNLTMNLSATRTTTLSTPGNPFSVDTQTNTETINRRTYTSVFTGSNRTYVNKSPMGRTVTIGLDSLERINSIQVEGLTATDFAYDSRGRRASATTGKRTTTFSYDSNGFLASITDPLQRTRSYTYDADGHVLTTTLPDGRVITYGYDANGNLTAVIPPGKPAHDFAYTAVDLLSAYTPPTVSGTGATAYAYDPDRDLRRISRPDGETIKNRYDTAGRLISIGTPTGTSTFSYSPVTGNLATAANGSELVTYSYNGPLPTGSAWAGTVAGSVSRGYNHNFWLTSQIVGGASTVTFQYDHDGLLIGAGSLTINRSSSNGLITGTTLGQATDSRTYNGFGELKGYTASANGAPVYSALFTRDRDGRISGKTETVAGVTSTYTYTYDAAGRLTAATRNGATDAYTYDTNSNRLSATTASGTSTGSYDAQDRLLTYGNASYTSTANGELASKTAGARKTTYTYDVQGNLIAAMPPSGAKITYLIDAENHRVGKTVNGVPQTAFLYDGDQIVAQLNGSNQIVSQFVYGGGAASPAYMVRGGVTYRIFSDRLGSPRVVVNTLTGAVVEVISYDEFGNVTSDTNPGFQPFGFAGGLYDQDTKLVRFGARDYSPAVGRWTAKDPILFVGGDSNLYGYVLSDPVNTVDPAGLQEADCPCEQRRDNWDSLVEPIVPLEGAMVGLGDVGTVNILGQIGATIGEAVVGPFRSVDYLFGLGLLRGSPELQSTSLWEIHTERDQRGLCGGVGTPYSNILLHPKG